MSDARVTVMAVLHRVAPDVDLDALDPDDDLRDQLDLDSIDFLAVVAGIEQRAGVRIPERDFPCVLTLADLVAYVSEPPGCAA